MSFVRPTYTIGRENGSVEVCVTKDLPTIRGFDVAIVTMDGTAQSESWVALQLHVCILNTFTLPAKYICT